MKKLTFFVILSFFSIIYSKSYPCYQENTFLKNNNQKGDYRITESPLCSNNRDPFFPGTLLQYVAQVLEPGHFAIEPYLLLTRDFGSYNRFSDLKNNKNIHQYEALLFLKAGLIKNIDTEVIINGAYTHSRFGDSFLYGDTLILFGLQLLKAEKKTWQPDIKLLVGENFPTGKYQNLNPEKNGIDGTGAGSFDTFFILSAGKIIYVYRFNPFNLNINLYYILPSHTSVTGKSVYGGGIGTKGTINPGQRFIVNIGIEYSLTSRWNGGIDIRYEHHNRSIFHPSNLNKGPPAGLPSSELLSLAPCLEYNPSKNFGINCGVWFSVAGRNTNAFTTPILSFFYYY